MVRTENKAVITIGGEAGYGIMSASDIICESLVRGGLHVFTRSEYPSLIRGGNNTISIRVDSKEIGCSLLKTDVLLALNMETIDVCRDYLAEKSAIIYNGDSAKLDKKKFPGINLYSIPMEKLLEESKLPKVVMNIITIGAGFAVLDYDLNLLHKAIEHNFENKKDAVSMNFHAAKIGYDYVKKNFRQDFRIVLKKIPKKGKSMIIDGNTALSLGAIKAGCKFLSAYPMTPASSIMNYFVSHESKADIVMKQAFDEITAVNMALGASYAGVRSMTSTSGGGLALMAETISLIGIHELPLVIVDVQRPGPATGLPTRQGQGDLKFVCNIGHGDFPKIVLAPGDNYELFHETFNAFNLAEKYQLPVIILSDKNLSSSQCSVKPYITKGMKIKRYVMSDDEAKKASDYKRFADTSSGISKRSLPGQKAVFRSSSDEHNERGEICELEQNKIMMEDKRFRKIENAAKEIPLPQIYGPKDADITIIGFGSTKNAILEAAEMLRKEKKKVNFLQILYIMPFHSDYVKNFLEKSKNVFCVEENKTGQLADIIRMNTGFRIKNRILKYGGRSFFPEEIFNEIKKSMRKKK